MGLELRNVSKRYAHQEVLHPLSLEVANGEFLTLLGPSGSGKTTVLRLIGGFSEVSGGNILFEGKDITDAPANRRPFNTVFQDYALFPHMTVVQNVGYGPLVQRRAAEAARKLIAETLEIVGLSELRDRYPRPAFRRPEAARGAGPRHRLRTQVILLDEPLAALDATLRRQMQVFLKQIQRRIQTTFIFVTHDQDEAITMSDRIVVMSQGRIEQTGNPARNLFPAPHPFRRRLLWRQQPDPRNDGRTRMRSIRPWAAFPSPPANSMRRAPRCCSRSGRNPCALARARCPFAAEVEEAMFGGALTKLLLRCRMRLTSRSTCALPAMTALPCSGSRRAGHRHLRSRRRRCDRRLVTMLPRLTARWLIFLLMAAVPVAFIVAPIGSFLLISFFRADKHEIIHELTLFNYVNFFGNWTYSGTYLGTILLCLEVVAAVGRWSAIPSPGSSGSRRAAAAISCCCSPWCRSS